MRDVSDLFAGQVRRGYTFASLVEVWGPGQNMLADSSTFNVVDGRISVDGTASIHRRLDSLVIADNTGDLVPDEALDLFSVVSSNELRVYTGQVVNGEPELLLQGIFGLEGCEVEDTSSGLTITLSAYDRARQVSNAKTTVPQKIGPSQPPGTTALTAAQALITQARAGAMGWQPVFKVLGIDPGTQSPYDKGGIPELVLDEGTDLWETARKVVADIGWECFFDWDGAVLMRPVLDPNSTDLVPVWNYHEGVDSTFVRISRGFSNEDAYNGQIVTGENTTNLGPARGQAWDDDDKSPTWYLGPYGRKPEFYRSETIRTDAQAAEVAKARLNQRKGANERLEFEIVPNHAHEVGDVVNMKRARSKLNSSYIIDAFELGLGARAGAMGITTRQRRVVV